MEVIFKGEPKEIAALVVAIQERRQINDPKELAETIRNILLEASRQS